MQGVHLRKYAVEATIDFEVYEVDGVDLRVDWVPAAADCEIMKDGGASTQCTNTATDEGSTYSIVLTATEMQAARLVLKVVDAVTKVFLDKVIVIETYGHASAQHAFDLDTAATTMRGTDSAALATALATHDGKIDAAQSDLDKLTGTDGATLATAQANYAPNKVVPDAAGTAATPAEVATALTTYDAPTKAEMDTGHALLATVAKQDAIKVVTDALADSAGTLVSGTVSHDNTAASTTVFYCDDITEATEDHFKGRIVIFTSGALQYQASDITAYALVSGEGKFTVTTLTEAPADNVTFVIV